jgi:hypothetical protein
MTRITLFTILLYLLVGCHEQKNDTFFYSKLQEILSDEEYLYIQETEQDSLMEYVCYGDVRLKVFAELQKDSLLADFNVVFTDKDIPQKAYKIPALMIAFKQHLEGDAINLNEIYNDIVIFEQVRKAKSEAILRKERISIATLAKRNFDVFAQDDSLVILFEYDTIPEQKTKTAFYPKTDTKTWSDTLQVTGVLTSKYTYSINKEYDSVAYNFNIQVIDFRPRTATFLHRKIEIGDTLELMLNEYRRILTVIDPYQ